MISRRNLVVLLEFATVVLLSQVLCVMLLSGKKGDLAVGKNVALVLVLVVRLIGRC